MTTSHRVLLGLAALGLITARPALADIFSPGELARAHQHLEGLSNCTKCHPAGKQLSQAHCLECHTELKGRVAASQGFHGRIPEAERDCWKCHHDHQGRNFQMVNWGPGGQKGFDHAKTGYALKGKHAPVACEKCHDPRLIADAGVRQMLAQQAGRHTFLGAPQACVACHFDEHRGQVGTDCQRCHTEDAWKPVRRFDHAKTKYPLTGKHVKVECAKCHKPQQDEQARVAGPGQTAPKNPLQFLKWKPLPFASCLDCHKDPHQDRLGPNCAGCHVTQDWKKLTGAGAQRAFHEKTKYPLRGLHALVACQACHGPWAPGQKAVLKGLRFGQCTDCHIDSHLGQLRSNAVASGREARPPAGAARPALAATACERCHTVNGWLPVRFEVEDHDKLRYKLEGAHRAASCAACHPKDVRLLGKLPVNVRADLERKRRKVEVSLAVLSLPRATECRSCHKDPHAGQFEPRMSEKQQGCATCHGVESFKKVRFDHDRDARFPLAGKHRTAACASCHRPDARGVVQYRPLPLACAGCHADVHAGQFLAKGQATTDCARCHENTAWKAATPAGQLAFENLKFRHEKPFTSYQLRGKHKGLECAKCHAVVQVGGAEVRRYKPLATACEGCHADFHKGAFKGYVP